MTQGRRSVWPFSDLIGSALGMIEGLSLESPQY
jgi:hypothetical protein